MSIGFLTVPVTPPQYDLLHFTTLNSLTLLMPHTETTKETS